jgi:hypothetical protein
LLYYSGNQFGGDVYLGSLESGPGQPGAVKLLTGVLTGLVYAASSDETDLGYVLFVRGAGPGETAGALMAQPFDLRRLALAGDPVPIAQGVAGGNFSASQTGALVYGSGGALATLSQLTLFDRGGKIVAAAGEPGNYESMALSPGGRRLAASRIDAQTGSDDLWVIDLARGTSTRFTFDTGSDMFPAWSPDGSRIAFSSMRGGTLDLYQKLSNGGGDQELLFKSDSNKVADSWSGDRRFFLFGEGSVNAPNGFVLPLDRDAYPAGKPLPFAQKGLGLDLRFSPGPQGRPLWVTYSSNESGRYEVYVRPFDPNSPMGIPSGGGKWQVSTAGGMSPRWNGNGKELFYLAPDGTVMSTEVSGSNGVFQSGVPKALFKPKGVASQLGRYFYWDASADGKKFVFAVPQSASGAGAPARFTVVLNWTSLLKK